MIHACPRGIIPCPFPRRTELDPAMLAGQLPRPAFRGLLDVHSRYGPRDALVPKRNLLSECFNPFLTSWIALSASGWNISCPARTFTREAKPISQDTPCNCRERSETGLPLASVSRKLGRQVQACRPTWTRPPRPEPVAGALAHLRAKSGLRSKVARATTVAALSQEPQKGGRDWEAPNSSHYEPERFRDATGSPLTSKVVVAMMNTSNSGATALTRRTEARWTSRPDRDTSKIRTIEASAASHGRRRPWPLSEDGRRVHCRVGLP
jgi:hypothetical protein